MSRDVVGVVVAYPHVDHPMVASLMRPWFLHCEGVFLPCLVDNVAHMLLRTDARIQRYAGRICRWHDDTVERRYIIAEYLHGGRSVLPGLVADYQQSRARRDARVARARNIRKARR